MQPQHSRIVNAQEKLFGLLLCQYFRKKNRADIDESPIWISAVETRNAVGRFIANLIEGKLD